MRRSAPSHADSAYQQVKDPAPAPQEIVPKPALVAANTLDNLESQLRGGFNMFLSLVNHSVTELVTSVTSGSAAG